MGFVFGIGSAFFFALSSVLIRIGQRHRTADDVTVEPDDDVVFLDIVAFRRADLDDAPGIFCGDLDLGSLDAAIPNIKAIG